MAFGILGLALCAGCVAPEPGEPIEPEPAFVGGEPGLAQVEEATPGVIQQALIVARIITGEGATVTFLKEREATDVPVISIAISSPESTPVIDALLAQQPSALELYRALRPDKAAPDELVREHRLLAQVDTAYTSEPRALSTAGSNITENFICGSFAAWSEAFIDWVPPLPGINISTQGIATTVYVGYAPKFYFDVCRTTSSTVSFVVRTERRSNPGAPWTLFDDGSPLFQNQRYRFFQNNWQTGCSSFQYRLYVNPVGGGSYYRGATWADERPCRLTS